MFFFAPALLQCFILKIMNKESETILYSQRRLTFYVNVLTFYKVRSMYLKVILLQCWIEQTVLLMSHFNFT